MKVGIIGSGMVGSTSAYAMIMRGVGREIVLVNRDRNRAEAEADDLLHAVPFAEQLEIYCGDYRDLVGCMVVVIAAGVNQMPGESRINLLERNVLIFRDIIPRIVDHAPGAILVIATNPVDIMTHFTARIAIELGIPATRVIGTGTTLDTARFRSLCRI